MIYESPHTDASVDQGDIIDDCPISYIDHVEPTRPDDVEWEFATSRIVVLTQTCDLANQRTRHVNVAIVMDAVQLVQQGLLKASDIRGSIRAGRVFGWYFLPKNAELNLPEMIVDLRQLHTVPLDLLTGLCEQNRRRGRLTGLYRAHLGKHFGDTFSRIGLPEPYETE